MAFDMVGAGIDTTGTISSFLAYNIARNPDKQEKLRNEIASFDETISEKSLNQMKYLRAFMKESARVNPLNPAGGRVVEEEFELNGFHIPKNVNVMWPIYNLGQDKRQFDEPER